MTRLPMAAAALGCALALGACNSTAVSNIAGTLTAGTITLGQLTPSLLEAAGATAADKAKAQAILDQIVATAKLSCGLAPTATSILNIVAALDPTASAVAVPISTVVSTACTALTAATSSPLTTVKATRMKTAAPAAVGRKSDILVNGIPVHVVGFGDPAAAVAR